MDPHSGWTVGHSNRPLEDFLRILQAYNIDIVIDVRRFPVSRKWPHFEGAALAQTLSAAGIDYTGLPELGGRRGPRPDSPHTAWRVEAFRGYADYMDTPEFEAGMARLLALAEGRRAALMCAEALPWRCHRSMIADALVARGWALSDILSVKESRPHELPPFARTVGQRLIYDG